MVREVTAVIEDYLEGIYKLQERDGVARTSELVKLLQVVPGTVTNTVERLERDGLVTHVPYKGVKLTDKGRRIALQVIRRHRLSERLLTDILHVEWEKVHEVACGLEHVIINDIEKNLAKALGHPTTCPHGNPIPTKCGGVLEEESQSLTELNPKEHATIVKIIEEKHALLSYLATLGLLPETSITIVKKAPLKGPITIKVDGKRHQLNHRVASIIKVKKRQ